MAAPHLWQFHFFAICIGDGAGGIVVNPLAICRPLCIAAFIYLTATIIPGLSVSVRRLHDVGKSGYFYFICCIPYIGGFILLYYFCKASEIGSNMYGETD